MYRVGYEKLDHWSKFNNKSSLLPVDDNAIFCASRAWTCGPATITTRTHTYYIVHVCRASVLLLLLCQLQKSISPSGAWRSWTRMPKTVYRHAAAAAFRPTIINNDQIDRSFESQLKTAVNFSSLPETACAVQTDTYV